MARRIWSLTPAHYCRHADVSGKKTKYNRTYYYLENRNIVPSNVYYNNMYCDRLIHHLKILVFIHLIKYIVCV